MFAVCAKAEKDRYWAGLFVKFAHGKEMASMKMTFVDKKLQIRRNCSPTLDTDATNVELVSQEFRAPVWRATL